MSPKSLSILWFNKKSSFASPFCKGGSRGISQIHEMTIFVCLFSVLLISGCGYRFTAGGEYIDKRIRTVFVDNFANRTSEAYIENTFRNAFINQFTIGSRFTIVDRREKADAIFRGSIDSLTTAPLSYQKGYLAAEERLTVTMELAFEEQDTKKNIWNNKSFSGYQDYATPDLNSKEANRKNALIKLSNDTAERAYRLMMSGF